jgi:hypothetical protein
MSRALPSLTTRSLVRRWPDDHPIAWITPASRPIGGGALTMTPLPVGLPNGQPYAGMDPSNPATYVRPWRPAPGMIGYLNFDGAARQDETPMGGVWGAPARVRARAGARPRKRPR